MCKGELCGVCQQRIEDVEDARAYGDAGDGDLADEAAERYFNR